MLPSQVNIHTRKGQAFKLFKREKKYSACVLVTINTLGDCMEIGDYWWLIISMTNLFVILHQGLYYT